MDENIATLIVGLAGIASTLISSSLGLYFIARARHAPLRELLFNKQIELITKILQKQELIKIHTVILMNKNYPHKDEVSKNLAKHTRDLHEFVGEGMAILPAHLWVELQKLLGQTDDILREYKDEKIVSESAFNLFLARGGKVGLISRAIIGADELTEESVKLFSSKKAYNNLMNIEVSEIKALIKKEKS